MHALKKKVGGENEILAASGAIDGAIIADPQNEIPVLARELRQQRLFRHDEASAITRPDGSSSPNTFPRSSSSSPSRTGIRVSGIDRRTRSSAAGARSRVESPVRRATEHRAASAH